MRIQLWRGYHGSEVRSCIEAAWRAEDRLLVLCPPVMPRDFSGFAFLPPGEIETVGDWDFCPRVAQHRGEWQGAQAPVLGLFTSGTAAGTMKLVLYSKNCVRASLNGILDFFDQSRIDSIFCYPQPFHTFGLLLGYVLASERGWPFYASDGGYHLRAHEERLRLSQAGLLTLGTPTHFQDLMSYVKTSGHSPQPSYSCIIGGAPVSVDLWSRLRNELLIEAPSIGYGATEASPGIAHLPAGRQPIEDNEIGLPVKSVKLQIRPTEGYTFSGEGTCLAQIYADRIEFPQEIFIADDLRLREDGILVFTGRSDLVLNRGGEKFPLERIESYLQAKLGIEALAFAVPDQRLGHELGLLIRSDISSEIIIKELSMQFRARFTARHFRQVEKFPTNANHKYDRRRALDML